MVPSSSGVVDAEVGTSTEIDSSYGSTTAMKNGGDRQLEEDTIGMFEFR